MNANELADKLEKDGEGCTCAAYCAGECACDANWAEYHTKKAATMLRQQAERINNLLQWQKRQLDVIEQHQKEKKALYNLVVEQDKKIIDLAFKLAYAERGNEIVLEANTRSRP